MHTCYSCAKTFNLFELALIDEFEYKYGVCINCMPIYRKNFRIRPVHEEKYHLYNAYIKVHILDPDYIDWWQDILEHLPDKNIRSVEINSDKVIVYHLDTIYEPPKYNGRVCICCKDTIKTAQFLSSNIVRVFFKVHIHMVIRNASPIVNDE